jgi:hypothetical protein
MSFALDASHDMHIDGAGLIVTVSGADAVRQNVLTALRLFRGEWFLAVSRGMPWFGEVLVANPNIRVIEFELRRTVLRIRGVTGIREMDLDFDRGTRELSISIEIDTEYGPSGAITL